MEKAAKDFSQAFTSGMEKGANTAGEDEKFLGLISMPPGVMNGLTTMWVTGLTGYSDKISNFLFRHTYDLGEKFYKPRTDKQFGHLRRGATMAANSVLLLGTAMPTFTKFMDTNKKQHKEIVEAAKRVAPVLEEIKGKHSVGVFSSIKAADNEVLYAHRRRIADKANLEYGNHFIQIFGQLPQLAKLMLKDKSTYKITADINKAKDAAGKIDDAAEAIRKLKVEIRDIELGRGEPVQDPAAALKKLRIELGDADDALDELKALAGLNKTTAKAEDASKLALPDFGPMEIITAGLTPLLGAFESSNKKRFDEKTPAYTALDMILTLERQVCDNPNVASFELPKGGKSSSRSSLALTEYVVEVIRHHQLDMESIDAEHTPIRKALDNQLKDIAEPIAKAIKAGDISALTLVRLVGEGHIIKNKGRSLAKPAEVKVLLEKMSANASTYLQTDPDKYFTEAAFNKKELKEAIDALEGEEKQTFAMMFPDSVLLEVGMSETDVKSLREATISTYSDKLGKIIVGLSAEEDKALHDMGLAKEEVKELRAVAEKVKSQGEEAVNDVRAKPNNPAGIERLLASAAVSQIVGGDTHYMGKLTSQAVEKKAEKAARVEDAEGAETSHAAKHTPNKKHAADHAENSSHAERESSRRESGSEQHEVGA